VGGAALFVALAMRSTRAQPLAVPTVWGLTGLFAAGAYIDSRFLLFFGRHAYHPATLELLLSPGSSDHSGVSVTSALLWVASWVIATVTFGAIGRWLRARTLAPRWVVWPITTLLLLNVAHEALASDAGEALDHYRSGLFLRGLLVGREGAASDAHAATYPLGPLGALAAGERPDVLLIIVESLRADALDEETMPALSRFAESEGAFVAGRHYAGANCTSNSFFTLLYGTNGAMFTHFNDTARPVASAPLGWLRESGYTLGFYTSQRLEWRHMDTLFVRPAFDVVVEETEGEVWERDARIVDRYLAARASSSAPTFSVIFFTATHHDYSFPEDRAPFQPSLRALDVMGTDLRPFRTELVNRYRNSVSYVDSLVGRVLDGLAQQGRLGATRIVITGDHGEEFLEHGHLTHASSLVEEQIHVPLIALGVPGLVGTSDALTSHEQILPTLLASIAPDLDFANVGTGVPLLEGVALPLVSECADIPGQFVAIEDAQKDWFTLEPSSVRLDFVSDAHDTILAAGTASSEALDRIRRDVGHFGHDRAYAGVLWPCPSVLARDQRFYVCDRWIAWTEASELCRSHGLELAQFADAEQNDTIAALATSPEHQAFWLSLTDAAHEGDFRWPDGSAPTFTRWAEGEPSNTGGREHCVQIDATGAWSDRACEQRERFVCGPAPRE
jgi:hypothetical protein